MTGRRFGLGIALGKPEGYFHPLVNWRESLMAFCICKPTQDKRNASSRDLASPASYASGSLCAAIPVLTKKYLFIYGDGVMSEPAKGHTWSLNIIVFIMSVGVLASLGLTEQQESVGFVVLLGAAIVYSVVARLNHRADPPPVLEDVPLPIPTESVDDMRTPIGVRKAVNVLWIMVGVDVANTIGDILIGNVSTSLAMAAILFYGLMCIFPYKIGNGSNASRYAYLIITSLVYVLMLIMALSTDPNLVKDNAKNGLDYAVAFAQIPFFTYAFYNLFQVSANKWFTRKSMR